MSDQPIEADSHEAIWGDLQACPIHTDRYDEDCAACEAELLERNEIIDRIGTEAGARLQGVAQMNGPDPSLMFMQVRLTTLCDTLFQHNARHLQQFEAEVARRTLLEIRRMQASLMDSVIAKPPKPGLHVVQNGREYRRAIKDTPQA